jgi:hypothetical protein
LALFASLNKEPISRERESTVKSDAVSNSQML